MNRTDLGGWDADNALAPGLRDERLSAQIRAVLQRAGRVHVPGFFAERAASSLFEACRNADWRVVVKAGEANYDLSPADVASLEVGQKVELLKAIHGEASAGFQYLFDSYRISAEAENRRLAPGVFADFFAALNSEPMLRRLRTLTGEDRIVYLDAQATRYRQGHFLTDHDDSNQANDRLFAYVINLTPVWRVDWGGLLMFPSSDGHVAEAFTPRWNAINILKVPQPHSVSYVTPFARGARYSITGWMRSKRP